MPPQKKIVAVFAFETSATYWSERIFHVDSIWKRLGYWLALPLSYPYFFGKIGLRRLPLVFGKGIVDRIHYLKSLFSVPSEIATLRAIRAFADRNDAVVVAKFRKKHPVPDFYRKACDIVIEEDLDQMPYTSAELIAAADLAITFYSGAAAEAGAYGTPVVNLVPSDPAAFIRDQYLFLTREDWRARGRGEEVMYNLDPGGIYAFPGVTTSVPVEKFADEFPRTSFATWKNDPANRENYRARHIAPEPGPSAPRIADQALAALARKIGSRD